MIYKSIALHKYEVTNETGGEKYLTDFSKKTCTCEEYNLYQYCRHLRFLGVKKNGIDKK